MTSIRSRVDPDFLDNYDAIPEEDYRALVETRASISPAQCLSFIQNEKRPDVKEWEITIAGPADNTELIVKVYEPIDRIEKLPGLLWIHGGGYMLDTALTHDPQCQLLCIGANCVVISPEYRLAPEYPYPAGLEDCFAALQWLYSHGGDIGVDCTRLAIGGASSGGGMCAALAHLNRDRSGPSLCLQMPLYPMLDCRRREALFSEFDDPKIWNAYWNSYGWEMYLGTLEKPIPATASPSLESDFSGLPPTFTFIGDIDLFRDETLEYIQKLSSASVPVELHLYSGCYHGFDVYVPEAKKTRNANDRMIEALKEAFASAPQKVG